MLEPRRKEADTGLPSLRNFGLTFTVVFALVGLIHVPFGGAIRLWALAISGIVLSLTLFAPSLLAPFNLVWFRFGMLLHRVVNPIVMAIIYFGMLVPMALTMRLFGKRLLQLSREAEARSYWIERSPPGPEPSSVHKQF